MQNTIGLSPKYVKDWTIQEAIREIVQNYIDSKNEFKCHGYITHENNMATVKDYGTGLKLKHLVLGISEKGSNSIGQFGEGLKLALLVFARDKKFIEIISNGKRITPEITYSEEFETEMINLNIEDYNNTQHKGTTINFECTEDELNAGKNYFLNYFKRTNKFEWVHTDNISKPGGNIWVNGSKVGYIENATLSYHLESNENTTLLNRDRGIIDRDNLEGLVRKKLGNTRSLKWIKEYLQIIKDEIKCWEFKMTFYSFDILSKNKKLWKRGVTQVLGKNLVLKSSNPNINTQSKYNGYRLTNIENYYHRQILKHLGIPTANEVLNTKIKMKNIAQKELNKKELTNLQKAKELIKNNYKTCGTVKVVINFESKANTLGMYNRKKDIIYIHQKVLNCYKDTIDVLLHETVHKHTGYSDCTSEFEDALTNLAVKFLLKGGE